MTCRNWNHFWLDEGLATFYELRSLVKLDQTVMHVSTKVQTGRLRKVFRRHSVNLKKPGDI